jgi:hypothetical protein
MDAFGCPTCRAENTGCFSEILAGLLWFLFVGFLFFCAFLWYLWQTAHPPKMEKIESSMVTEHKAEIDDFMNQAKSKRNLIKNFEGLSQETYPAGPLSCGEYFLGHTDRCIAFRAFFQNGLPEKESVYCEQALAFAKAIGATKEFTMEVNEPSDISSGSLGHCIDNFRTGYLLTGTSKNNVPFAIHLIYSDYGLQLTLSPRYENPDMKLVF